MSTMLSPELRPQLLGGIEQVQQRTAIEAALFGSTATVSVGRFRLLHRLGEGGMGTVYAAFDDRLDRKIAVKLIRTSRLDSAEARERTLREARALARLSHPHVVHVYEVGEVEGQLFVAMEFLAGPTLRAWLDEGQHSWQRAVSVYRQAGEGLAAAHDQGIIHRDFKPHNAMFGADGRVRVLDFGLARLGESQWASRVDSTTSDESAEATITRAGTLLGTPAYMSPEQLEGRPADARSDQFGFCVSLYEALYGQRPFVGHSLSQLLQAVTHGPLAEPSSAVPTWLRKVVVRGLAYDPAQRFASMRALLDALADDPKLRRRRWLAAAGLIGLVGGASWGAYAAARVEMQACDGLDARLAGVWDEPRKQDVKAALLATGLNYAPSTWERVAARLDDYTSNWVAARTEICEATQRGEQSGELLDLRMACLDRHLQSVEALVHVLANADQTVVSEAVNAVASLPKLELCDDVEALRAEVLPPADEAVAARVRELDEQLTRAQALRDTGKYTESLALLERLLPETEATGYEPVVVKTTLALGSMQRVAGDYETASATLERAFTSALAQRMRPQTFEAARIRMFVEGVALAHFDEGERWAKLAEASAKACGHTYDFVNYHAHYGGVLVREKKFEAAREQFERGLAIANQEGVDPKTMAALLNNLADVANSQGRYTEALELFERVVAIHQERLGPDHPLLVTPLSNLASTEILQGRHTEAREHGERALSIAESALGPQHPEVLAILGQLAQAAFFMGEYERAREDFERLLAIQEQQPHPEAVRLARTHSELGRIARAQGRFDEAQRYLERALQLWEQGGDLDGAGVCLLSLGNLANAQGNDDDAREYFERALASWQALGGPRYAKNALALASLANLSLRHGSYEQAAEQVEQALDIFRESMSPDSLYIVMASAVLGNARLGQGRTDEALTLLEAAVASLSTAKGVAAELADARFSLARALVAVPEHQARDVARARELARAALAAYTELGDAHERDRERIESWLREQPE